MIPLAVVSQGAILTDILIDGHGVDTTIIGGIFLDEEYRKVRSRWPVKGEKVRFIITSNVKIYPREPNYHAINSGSHWDSSNSIFVENRAKCYGHGGAGGMGAFVYRHNVGSTGLIRMPAKNGEDGFAAVSNTTAANMVIDNYGLICSGGGGGGGGAAWDFIESNGQWASRRNGTTAGGGAPFGAKSLPVGTPYWYFKLSDPQNYEAIKVKYDNASFTKPKPWLGLRNDGIAYGDGSKGLHYWHANGTIYNGKPNLIDINTNTPVDFTLANPFLNKYGLFELPEMLPYDTMTEFYNRIYPALTAKNYAASPLTRRYANSNLLRQQMAAGSIDFPSGIGPYVLMSSDADMARPGWGGSTMGVARLPGTPGGNFFGFHGTAWYGTGSGYNPLPVGFPLAWDDNFGGDGGELGASGANGYYNHLFLTQLGTFQQWKRGVKRQTKDELDAIRNHIDYEPPALGGLAGYLSVGNVTINNFAPGILKGRVKGGSGDIVSRGCFEFYHVETDARKINRIGHTRQVTRLGLTNHYGESFGPSIKYFNDEVLPTLDNLTEVDTWPTDHYTRSPARTPIHLIFYTFEITLPTSYNELTHNVVLETTSIISSSRGTEVTHSVVGNKLKIVIPTRIKTLGDGVTGYFTISFDHKIIVYVTRK